jgi:hypothetical protein
MNKNSLKSIGAILIGFIAGFILSIGTDIVLNKIGLVKMDPFNYNVWWIILLVIIYRSVYNVLGCYIAAALAPDRPMRHAMILGTIGFAISIVGTIVMWDKPPHWYPISLILLTLPCAWIGGKLKTM